MDTMYHRDLIVTLIKDDLIHSKLIMGFHALGIDASQYYLHLSETIFELMDISAHEQTYARYLDHLRTIQHVDITDSARIHAMSEEIYTMLLADTQKSN